MTLIAGIDPGTGGAVAIYDTESQGIMSVHDLPYWYQSVGKKKRKRLDPVGLVELFEELVLIGVQLVVMEAVGGRPRQGASSGFVFGYTVGLLYMGCINARLMVETVPPQRWKKMLNVPGKAKGADDDIMNRCDELFPHQRAMFRGARGGKEVDRAEAAMMAKFGGDYVWRTMPDSRSDVELKLAYRNGDTGA